MYTTLTDRKLWYDGDSSYNAQHLMRLISRYKVRWVDQDDAEVAQYNHLVPANDRIRVKRELSSISSDWIDSVSSMSDESLVDYIFSVHNAMADSMSADEHQQREARLVEELELFAHTPHMIPMLKTMVHIITTLESSNVVWGVGRGSSVSSYVLYVIGAHDVDSFAYELDVHDFISEDES